MTELTVGSGSDVDNGRLSRPLLCESAHKESVLGALLQALYGHRLPLRVSHRDVEQIYMFTRL